MAQLTPLIAALFDIEVDPRLLTLAKKVGEVALVVVLTIVAYRMLVRGLASLEKRQRLTPALGLMIRRLLRWLASVVAILLVLQALEVLENAWAAVTAVLALIAVGFFAVWSVLSNTLCAVLLIVNRPFGIGDEIEIPSEAGGIKGRVVNFNLIYTTLRAADGALLQIPNNLFFQKPLRRFPGHSPVSLDEQLLKETNAE